MKINGNTVGTTMPRSNFNQTDPKKADYIVGRENIATKDDLISTMFFTEDQLPIETETDVTSLVTYKPSFSEAQDHFGYTSSADNVPHMRVVRKQGVASYTAGELLPLVAWSGAWASLASFSLYFANKDYKLTLTYQYDNNYTDLLYVKALLTKEASIGDIETALDELHTYAQALISGGEAI